MRRAAALGLAAAVLLLTAAPAAASSVTAPAEVTAHGEVPLLGVVDERFPTGVAELRLTGPGGVTGVPVARAQRPTAAEPRRDPTRVEFPLTTAPCNVPGAACEGGKVLANGTWTVQLFEVDRPRSEDVERGTPATVVVAVPALEPQDVVASLEGRTVTVRWARGVGPGRGLVEPDVRWTVSDSTGVSVSAGPDACADGTCTAQLTYPDAASGPRTVSVTASRPGTAKTAAAKAPGEVVLPAAAGASAAPSPDGSPSPAATEGGAGQATARSLGQSLGGFAPGAELPRLPGLSSPSPDASVAAPQVADTFLPELDYDDRVVEELVVPEPQAAPAGRGGVLTATDGGLLGDEAVARGLAGALVLVLAGAHLRTWLAGSSTEP